MVVKLTITSRDWDQKGDKEKRPDSSVGQLCGVLSTEKVL